MLLLFYFMGICGHYKPPCVAYTVIHTMIRTFASFIITYYYLSTECIELISANSEVQSTTNVVTTITTAITHTATNTTTANIVTSSSVSVATPTAVQITSSQNSTGL